MKNIVTHRAKALGLLAAVASLAVFTSAQAHHSFAMYDQTKDVTLTGRLTRFIPGGNHAQLLFQLVDENGEPLTNENGEPDIWGVETAPSATIAREGITVESFPIGTVLTVTINPLRNGKPFGALARGSSIVKCGDAVPEGGCNEETGQAFLGLRE